VAVILDQLLKISKALEDVLASLENCRTKIERQIRLGRKAKQIVALEKQLTLRYMSLTMIKMYLLFSSVAML
jgi:hypothetical protein